MIEAMTTLHSKKPIDEHLERVYGAATTNDLSSAYAGWAQDYDADVASMGYRFPALAAAMLARHLTKRDAAILDVGAGTGLVGSWLHDLGYTNLTATDFSPEMLKEAQARGVYAQAKVGDLLKRLPFPDDAFEAVIAVGVFTQGHVSVEGLEEVLRVAQSGAAVVVPLMVDSWERLGFQAQAEAWEASGRWQRLDQTPWSVPMPNAADHKQDLGAVFVWRMA